MKEYTVLVTWDEEAQVWSAISDEIPLALESGSLDALIERVKMATPEILELNGKEDSKIRLFFKAERQALVV
mgnify:FL=1